MKIGIVGLGIIGSALKNGFEKELGFEVVAHDTKFPGSVLENVLYTDVVFICVPTPVGINGSCNTTIVETVVYSLVALGYGGIIAVKSTVSPGTTEKMIAYTGNDKICFVPEFLRERFAEKDFLNMRLLAVGTHNQEVYRQLVKVHGWFPHEIKKLHPTEAELLKYMSNSFNATKIIFANTFYKISKKLGINYDQTLDAFLNLGTAVDAYLDCNENLQGYAGMCLPKDVAAMEAFVKQQGLDLKLFETLQEENAKLRKTVFDGMRME